MTVGSQRKALPSAIVVLLCSLPILSAGFVLRARTALCTGIWWSLLREWNVHAARDGPGSWLSLLPPKSSKAQERRPGCRCGALLWQQPGALPRVPPSVFQNTKWHLNLAVHLYFGLHSLRAWPGPCIRSTFC